MIGLAGTLHAAGRSTARVLLAFASHRLSFLFLPSPFNPSRLLLLPSQLQHLVEVGIFNRRGLVVFSNRSLSLFSLWFPFLFRCHPTLSFVATIEIPFHSTTFLPPSTLSSICSPPSSSPPLEPLLPTLNHQPVSRLMWARVRGHGRSSASPVSLPSNFSSETRTRSTSSTRLRTTRLPSMVIQHGQSVSTHLGDLTFNSNS